MAESVDSMHFAANSKTNSPKPLIAKRPPESRPQSSSDIFPPPPKKVRVEEKGLKHRKLNGEVCAGEKHNGKQSCGSPAKWSFGPAKASHSTAAAVPATPVRKIFKISNFLASPHKVKKAKEKRHKEKSSEAQQSPGAAVERVSPASCHTKPENGDVKMLQRGRRAQPGCPVWTAFTHFMGKLKPTREAVLVIKTHFRHYYIIYCSSGPVFIGPRWWYINTHVELFVRHLCLPAWMQQHFTSLSSLVSPPQMTRWRRKTGRRRRKRIKSGKITNCHLSTRLPEKTEKWFLRRKVVIKSSIGQGSWKWETTTPIVFWGDNFRLFQALKHVLYFKCKSRWLPCD